jgi:hypothetical protein
MSVGDSVALHDASDAIRQVERAISTADAAARRSTQAGDEGDRAKKAALREANQIANSLKNDPRMQGKIVVGDAPDHRGDRWPSLTIKAHADDQQQRTYKGRIKRSDVPKLAADNGISAEEAAQQLVEDNILIEDDD